MIIKHKISMDLTNRGQMSRLFMVQCDTNTRAVEFCLTADGQPWKPETVDTVFLRYRKADGTGGSYDTLPDGTAAWSWEGNRLTVVMAPQVLTVPGIVEAQAALLSENLCAATFGFQIAVEEDPSLGAVESENYVNWTAWAKAELDRHLQEARDSGEFDGACFLPAVDGEGNLIWSNDRGAENPEGVNIVELLSEKLGKEMFLKASGGAMTGNLDMSGNRVTGLAEPEGDSDAVPRAYLRNVMRQESITLAADGWAEQRQTAVVSAVTADSIVFVSPAPDSYTVYGENGLRCIEQSAGSLSFACDTVPEGAVTVHVAVFG